MAGLHLPQRRRPRRGIALSSLLVFVWPLIAVMIGLALEFGISRLARERLQTAADAAALAGGVDLLDPNAVKPGYTPDVTALQTTASHDAALYANLNLMLGAPLVYPTPTPIFAVFGNVADPTDYNSPFGPNDAQHPCNTLVVTIERSQRHNNPVPLRLGPFLGVLPGNVVATCRATLDQRVYGFRPVGDIPIPVIPLTVLASGSAASWTTQAQAAAVAGVNDNYTVDQHTGQVTSGPDGIPEVIAQAPTQGGPAPGPNDNMAEITIPSPNSTATLIVRGMRPPDLTTFGGQFAFDSSGSLTVQASQTVDSGLTGSLQQIQGANRIWPLYSSASGTDYTITQFVAGRIAQVNTATPGVLSLTVQPSVYATPTALVEAGQPLNPFVAKIGLTR